MRIKTESDLLEFAWGIIANAGGGDWEKESEDWRGAAIKWRDEYHKWLYETGHHGSGGTEAPKE